MIKKVFFLLSIFSLFLITSCADLNGGGYNKNHLNFEISSRVADSITRTLIQNYDITDSTEVTIECELLRGETLIKKDSLNVKLIQLYDSGFNLTNIPNGNNYFVSLSVYYKNHLVYKALSDLIVLNEENEEVNINLSLKQNNSKITYKLNGGEFVQDQKVYTEYFINSKATLPKPVKDYADFLGWYDNSSFTGEPVTELGKAKFVGDITLYAKWIDYAAPVVMTPSDSDIDYGDKITLTNKDGAVIHYTFGEEQVTDKSPIYTAPIVFDDTILKTAETLKINAIAVKEGKKTSEAVTKTYNMKKYTVTFDKNGHGQETPAKTGLRKCSKVTLPILTADKMNFKGWLVNGELKAGGTDITVTNNITVNASWEGVVDSVIFSCRDSVDYGEKVTLTCATPGSTIFYSIIDDSNAPEGSAEKEYTEPIVIKNNMSIKARGVKAGLSDSISMATYLVKTYTVTFDKNGHGGAAEYISELKKTDSLKGKKPADPTENGYTFVGWYKTSACSDKDIWNFDTDTITGKITLYAKWTLNPVASPSFEILPDGIKIKWTNPAASDLSGISITCTEDSTKNIELGKTATEHKVTGLDSNKYSYTFKIKAKSKGFESAEKSVTVNLPENVKFSTINEKGPNNSNDTVTFNVVVTGKNFTATGFSSTSFASDLVDGVVPTVTVNSDTQITLGVTVPKNIPSTGKYDVTLNYGGIKQKCNFSIRDYAVGDTVYSDGSISTSKLSGLTPVAVIFRAKSGVKPALGVGLKDSCANVVWAKVDTYGASNVLNKIICSPSATDPEASAPNKTFEGVTDGHNSWKLVCEEDSTGTGVENAEKNYPAFYWANNYGTSPEYGLSGTKYEKGWYLPTIAELYELYKAVDINTVISNLGGNNIETNTTYWSSSQVPDNGPLVWRFSFADGSICTGYGYKSGANANVRCIRAF